MVVALAGELVISEGVPQLDSLIGSGGDDLSVV